MHAHDSDTPARSGASGLTARTFSPQPLPVDAVLPELALALVLHGRAVLTASPGSGKTTRVPLALAGLLPWPGGPAGAINNTGRLANEVNAPDCPANEINGLPARTPARPAPSLPGTILVLEPRRLAARAAARHMAALLGDAVGGLVGYRVRLESKVSARTRVEMLTEGMFTRRLLADPELGGVSCVIFDEFHERSLQADLGLALCLECAGALRPDLKLLFMSATLEADELSRFLGNCPVIEARGSNWPVTVRHPGRELCLAPGASLEEIAAKSALAVRESLRTEPGGILAFLPGQAEIRRCAELLERLPDDADLHPLYGDLSAREQDAAIAPPLPGRRKVVLATDLAQTSLTIEGVRVVIDAGLARGPRFEPGTGLSRLVTGRVSRDAADQRAGRAGRLEPGLCLRLWPQGEVLAPQSRPEILEADLTALALEALAWGSDPAALPWLTPPPPAALTNAANTLLALRAARPAEEKSGLPGAPSGNLTDTPFEGLPGTSPGNRADGQTNPPAAPRRLVITSHGERLARLPLHPRLAHMVLQAADLSQDMSSLAACLAALVSERDPLRKNGDATSADIRLRLPLFKRPENRRLKETAAQIHRLSGLKQAFRLPGANEEDFSGALLSLAWPERIARSRGPGSFRLASGQGAELPVHDPLAAEPWLATAALGGGVNRRIHLAAPLALDDILHLHEASSAIREEFGWDSRTEAVAARSLKVFGALVLEEKPLPPSPALEQKTRAALTRAIAEGGLDWLPWTDELRQLRARVRFLRDLDLAQGKEESPWPDLSDAALLAGLADEAQAPWLSPWLEGMSRRSQLGGLDLAAALQALLPWPLPKMLDAQAPARLELPSGANARIDYLPVLRGDAPVLAVKLQEMFGQSESPRLAGGRARLMLHLLSPAGRPLQVTADLSHFWHNAYKEVRAEMRGRYPKHPWPEDPLSARPTGKTKKRLEAGERE